MKLAICNEVLGEMSLEDQCAFSRAVGYEGLELAPYTLSDEPHLLSAKRCQEIKKITADNGIAIAGLHWLLNTPAGLSITTEDEALRLKTIDVMRRLIDLCADLGGDYLVHGSPAQRRLPEDEAGAIAARQRGIDAWASIANQATQAGLSYCIEALAEPQANFVNSVKEAAEIVDQINAPGLRTMVDCSATNRMAQDSIVDLINTWMPTGHLAHIQVNDTNRRGPGQGDDDFAPIVAALKQENYTGWIGVEPFVYEPNGPTTAAFSSGYMSALIGNVI